MDTVNLIVEYLWWFTAVGYFALYLRLRHERLHCIYRFFSFYLLFRTIRAGVLVAAPQVWVWAGYPLKGGFLNNKVYGRIWGFTEPLVLALYVLIVLEVAGLVLKRYPAIASLGRWAILAGLVAGVLIASLTLGPDVSGARERELILKILLVLQRGVTSSLVLFLFFVTGFLAWYPVPLNRNVVLHAVLFTVFFVSNSATGFLRNLKGFDGARWTDLVTVLVTWGCLALWFMRLKESGEQVTVRVHATWSKDKQEHLLGQLSAVNASLMRSGPK